MATAQRRVMLVATLLVAATACTAPLNGVAVEVEQRFTDVSTSQLVDAFFSERVALALADRTGMRRREVLRDDITADGVRHRRVRLWLPSPGTTVAALPGVPADDELFYDEVTSFDPRTQVARFFVITPACERVKYGGTIRFSDGVIRVSAVLDVDAPVIGALIEGMVLAGVKDGYDTMAALMRRELAHARVRPAPTT
jgi:hypothetical protein